MKKLTLFIALAVFVSVPVAHAQVSKEKRVEIERMLRLTGMEKLMDQMKVQMISSLKTTLTDVPAGFWEKFQQKMDTHELLEKIIPLYDKYYTTDDLKAVNAFYESPAGQKMLKNLPQIMQEAMTIGQEWGKKIGEEAATEALKEKKK